MSTDEEYEERGFPIRSLIIKFLIIIIVILLLIWLLPKFIKTDNNKNTKLAEPVSEEKVYKKNVSKMENAAYKYYTEDNLPKENGKYKQVTVKELQDKKLIGKIKDHNNKPIDANDSYIKITKSDDNEYVLKINIKDSVKEDYVLLTVGHYSYCTEYLCEKREETKDETTTETENNSTEEVTITDTPVKGSVSDNNQQTTTAPVILDESYKYVKTIPAQLSDWSSWSKWETIKCNSEKEVYCDNNDSKCLTEVSIENTGSKCYKSTRTRTITISGYTITRWSTDNNQTLLNDGWVYIGK